MTTLHEHRTNTTPWITQAQWDTAMRLLAEAVNHQQEERTRRLHDALQKDGKI